jgi:zinc protease
MRTTGTLALLAVTLALGAALPRATGADPDTRLVTLPNGLRLLLAPDTSATAVDVAVWYGAGTVHEHAGITGVSHLLEHLMFRGSEHHGPQEHSRLVQAAGGAANAYTAPDYACYYQTVPPGALDLVLRLEADRIGGLRLTADGLEAEKRVLREERRWGSESGPRWRALERLDRLVWTRHPYRWPVTGLVADLDRITLADCQAYYRSHYGPNDATVTIVGDFDPQEALQSARHWLEPLPRRAVSRDVALAEPPQTAARRAFVRADLPVPMLAAGWRTPGRPDPDAQALRLLTHVLATGPASRLQQALVRGPTQCLSVECSLDSRRDGGLLVALVTAPPDADSARVESTLVAEVEKLARQPVSAEELERARRQEEIGQLFSWQTARGRAEALGWAQLVEGDYRAADLGLERLHRVTPADLQRAAARVLVARGRNVVWMVPEHASDAPTGGGMGSGAGRPAGEGGR